MKIAVLCIATNFKVRMKIGNKALITQEDRKGMSRVLDEIDLWVRNSKEELVPIVITSFDEIYEMAVQRHFQAFRNEFGFVSEGHMIRFGITSYPDADAYFIVSTGETRFFRAEIFEALTEQLRINPNKIIISRYDKKLSLPMLFSNQFIEPVHSIVDRENGRFVLRSNSKNAFYWDIAENILQNDRFHRNQGASLQTGEDQKSPEAGKDGDVPIQSRSSGRIVLIRGGGRIATAVAVALHREGYRVVITEKENPATLFRENSFARTVDHSEASVSGVRSYLVSPSVIQIKAAWKANSIPVIIDPDLETLQFFDQKNPKSSLFNDMTPLTPPVDILTYLGEKSEHPSESSGGLADPADHPGEEIRMNAAGTEETGPLALFALIDATSSAVRKPTDLSMAPVTIGLRGDLHPALEVRYKIETKYGSQYGKIIDRQDLNLSRVGVKSENAGDGKEEKTGDSGSGAAAEILHFVPGRSGQQEFFIPLIAQGEGQIRFVGKTGDFLQQGAVAAKIETPAGDSSDLAAPVSGRLVACGVSGRHCIDGEITGWIDPSGISLKDCFEPFPADSAIVCSILTLLKKHQ